MENRLSLALRNARNRPGFIDLINTNFHACGLYPDDRELHRAYTDYLSGPELRPYQPHPAGMCELRETIASWYASVGLGIGPDQVVVTASASESYSHIFQGILGGPGSSGVVLLPRPGYPLFEDVALRCGLEPRSYDLRPHQGWAPDLEQTDAMLAAAAAERRPVALVLISPNNPTGHVAGEATVRTLCEQCERYDAALITDEVFSEYRFGASADASPARPAVLGPATRAFTINGASKLLASPDLKVSWIVATGPDHDEAVDQLEIEADVYLNSSPLNQYAASRLLARHTGDEATTRHVVGAVARRREIMLRSLENLQPQVRDAIRWIEPEGGIHLPILVDDRLAPDDEEIAIELLDRFDLALHPGYLYGIQRGTVLVVSYLSPPEVIREGVARLEAYFTFVASR